MACFMTLLAALLALISFTNGQTFTLQHTYTGTDFFNNGFNVYAGFDPTYGFVEYVNLDVAQQHGIVDLANVKSTGKARWGVDTQSTLDPNGNLGRKSLRLQSAATYTHGLFVLDVNHVPANTCGTWPAFWLVGVGTWPSGGEIDILENINNVVGNLMSLHSSPNPNCTVAGVDQTGTLLTNDCAYGNSYTGCAVAIHESTAAGHGLNTVSGGVYAMLWTSGGIQMWIFPRNSLPASLADTTSVPILSEFGTPMANFKGSCDFDAHFHDQQIIFNIDFCGSNAGNNFEVNGCSTTPGKNAWESCNIYVANNPQAFTESYWEVNSLKVFNVVAGPAASQQDSSSIPVASKSSISSLSSESNGRPTTPTSPIVLPSTTTVQARDLTSVAGATWPTSFTPPGPFPTTAILARDGDLDELKYIPHTRGTKAPYSLCPNDLADPAFGPPDPQTAHTERTGRCLKTGWNPPEAVATASAHIIPTSLTGLTLVPPTRSHPTAAPQWPGRDDDDTKLVFDRAADPVPNTIPPTTNISYPNTVDGLVFPGPSTTHDISTGHVVIPDFTTYPTSGDDTAYSYTPKTTGTVSPTSVLWTGDGNPLVTVVPAAAQHGGGGTIRHGGRNSSYVAVILALLGVAVVAFWL